MATPRTLLHALHERATTVPDRPALWTRRHGYYLPLSWRDFEARVKHLALGIMALGLEPAGRVAILCSNREEWVVAELAAMAVGGVPVGLHVTASPAQLLATLAHCEAALLFVEDEQLLARVLPSREQLPRLEHIVVMDAPRTPPPGVLTYQQVLTRGLGRDEGPYWDGFHALEPGALAMLLYTSGSTGHPRGVMLSHRNLCWTAQQLRVAASLGEDEVFLSSLPLPHIAEQLASVHAALLGGSQVYFAESLERLPQALREVRPTVFQAVPRIWERLKVRAEEELAALPPARGRMTGWARETAADVLARQLAHEWIPGPLEAQYQLARRLVLDPLKGRLGLDRCRFLASSSAPVRRDVLDFFLSLDLVIHEAYGQAEATGPISLNAAGAARLGTQGRPVLGVAVRIAEDGEILVRGENVCMGLHREPEATARLLGGGWLRSGDLGELDDEGYLRVAGRREDLLLTADGRRIAPGPIEALLDGIPPLGHAMVVGGGRDDLCALLPLDPERVTAFARARRWPAEPQALAVHPDFLAYLDERIDAEVNRRLSRAGSIRRYRVLPHGLSVEAGELTPTLKLRRRVVEERYRELIEAMYAEGSGEGSPSA